MVLCITLSDLLQTVFAGSFRSIDNLLRSTKVKEPRWWLDWLTPVSPPLSHLIIDDISATQLDTGKW
jgi:hypothetical protein